jgi:predicted nucleic acid-binding protein
MSSGPTPRRLYWDACVFLSYFEATPNRINAIDQVLAEVEATRGSCIYTSQISIVEVANTHTEKDRKRLDDKVRAAMDDLWFRNPLIQVVEVSRMVAVRARDLMRQRLLLEQKLTPPDAIHLATAQWLDQSLRNGSSAMSGIDEVHTYDGLWGKYEKHLGLTIREPSPFQSSFGL